MGGFLDAFLDESAGRCPNAVAFRFGGEDLSYRALKERADRLADWLRAHGQGPGSMVGVHMPKSLDLPVAVYGILKSGAAYVPLDPTAPPERTARLIDDCGITALLTSESMADGLADVAERAPGLRYVLGANLDRVKSLPFDVGADREVLSPDRSPDDPAYVIFTSGSTGTPKGIVHTHRSARAYAEMAAELYDLRASDRMGNHSALHFDMSTFEFFSGVSRGATIVLIPEVVTKFPASMSKLIEDERLTIWYSVPFALIQLAEAGALDTRDITSLRWIIFAGEPMSPTHLNALQKRLPKTRFSNAYGPAEVNVVTYHHLPPEPHDPKKPIPIGVRCAHSDLRVEDGALLAATPAMMRGYLGRPDLDAQAFTKGSDGQRFYRTGDLVSTDSNGNLLYLGRADRQVKIRGYRVELQEVEHVLSGCQGVSEAAVLPTTEGTELEAFVTAEDGRSVDAAEIRKQAGKVLPPHAVPSKIAVISALPRTSTGKIDRNALRREVPA